MLLLHGFAFSSADVIEFRKTNEVFEDKWDIFCAFFSFFIFAAAWKKRNVEWVVWGQYSKTIKVSVCSSVCTHTHTHTLMCMSAFFVPPHVSLPLRKHLCFPHTAGQAFISAALTLAQLCVKWTTCVCLTWLCVSHLSVCERESVCVYRVKPVHLFPLWSAYFSIRGHKRRSWLGRCLC